ncbi:hypothetical protein OLMES_5153 [Oleiphilus messinensis]|uniref:Winged helix-turn-helix domain-containing protein n=1 Tax=Oleiphilus messinensis TaxID=141451 RepID=A0A1Y0IF19_9GAMM|nr:crosslink repair DNA glycosylase YcaQ family protein [Oleiphilus messinensis]ARU59137.1 hypothetical protein OLMES_5153 [Oleiphilus messinensis]
MIKITRPQDMTRLRRLALSGQGLLQSRPFGTGLAGARKAIQHLGYVQIDTISVVERAHHHVLHSRVPKFDSAMTHQLLLDGEVFEYWSHAAAFLPIDDFRFSLPYKQAIKSGQTHWFKTPDRKLMAELLARIRSEGPLRSRDLEADAPKRAGWWDWKPAKKALEQLYMEGDLMVSNREGFQKTYDLTERVLPDHINTQEPTTEEFAEHLIAQQLRCHGCISLKGLTYQRRNSELRKAVKVLINADLAEGVLEQIQVLNGDIYFIEAGALERQLPRVSSRVKILSPFDNSVIQRERLKALFQYDYQLESYLPADKRQFGYFCLPLMFRDEFVGRMDCKVYRQRQHLEIKSLYIEKLKHGEDEFFVALGDALRLFCEFQKCQSVSLIEASPAAFTKQMRHVLAQF